MSVLPDFRPASSICRLPDTSCLPQCILLHRVPAVLAEGVGGCLIPSVRAGHFNTVWAAFLRKFSTGPRTFTSFFVNSLCSSSELNIIASSCPLWEYYRYHVNPGSYSGYSDQIGLSFSVVACFASITCIVVPALNRQQHSRIVLYLLLLLLFLLLLLL